MSKFKYCLAQLLDHEIQPTKHKEILNCKDCSVKMNCNQYANTQKAFDSLLSGEIDENIPHTARLY